MHKNIALCRKQFCSVCYSQVPIHMSPKARHICVGHWMLLSYREWPCWAGGSSHLDSRFPDCPMGSATVPNYLFFCWLIPNNGVISLSTGLKLRKDNNASLKDCRLHSCVLCTLTLCSYPKECRHSLDTAPCPHPCCSNCLGCSCALSTCRDQYLADGVATRGAVWNLLEQSVYWHC